MLAQAISITHGIPSDVVALTVLFIVFFIYSVYFGRNRTIALVFAYYPAVLLYKTFPYADKLLFAKTGEMFITLNKVGIFLVFFLPLYVIISRHMFIESMHAGKASMLQGIHIFRNIGLSLVCLSVVILFSYTVVDLSIFHNFSGGVDALLATPTKLWLANLVPLALLAFL